MVPAVRSLAPLLRESTRRRQCFIDEQELKFQGVEMRFLSVLLSVFMLSSCGGGGGGGASPATSFSVGGSITGLGSASGLVLGNGTETLPVAANAGTFTFTTRLGSNAGYNVSVIAQPAGLVCTVSAGVGTIGSTDVNTVVVACVKPQATVSTLAGDARVLVDGVTASARFNNPQGVAVDSQGNIYVADAGNNVVRKISPARTVSTWAGDGTCGSVDGPGTAARLCSLSAVATDSVGNVYVAAGSIRKISPAGMVTTLALLDPICNGLPACYGGPTGIAVDNIGNVYVTDMSTSCVTHTCWHDVAIRKISPSGVVTLLTGVNTGFVDGPLTVARFSEKISAVAVDGAGNVFVADAGNHAIRKISGDGMVSTLAGNGHAGFADGSGLAARFNDVSGVAVDGAGNVYAGDTGNSAIRKISSTGMVTTLAGGSLGFADGVGAAASFRLPTEITVGSAGTVYVADSGNNAIRTVAGNGLVTTVAGNGPFKALVDGVGIAARFNGPEGVATDSNGTIFVADTANNAIRKISSAGVVTTLAGNGIAGLLDGTGAAARFNSPRGLVLDSVGNVFVADSSSHAIRKISPTGVVTTLAGDGTAGFINGPAATARFADPWAVAIDLAGTVYVADRGNYMIRKISLDGIVSTLAGTGHMGCDDADGFGSVASFGYLGGVAVDGSGTVYVSDARCYSIRKISSGIVVSTLAGNGQSGSADGTGSAARFSGAVRGVALDGAGNLYVADGANSAIRKVSPLGVVSTLVGGIKGFRDGPGDTARFDAPYGVALDRAGNLFVADTGNSVIRKIVP